MANIIRFGGGSGSFTPTEYTDNMVKFFSIPGASGKIRLKVEKPTTAAGVMLRWKATAWTSGDTEATGTLIATITDDANYKGANEWYEATGLTDGIAYYIKAFPYNSNTVYNVVIGSNETLCKAGGLVAEHSADSISGTTVYDTSGNALDGTIVGTVVASNGLVGNAFSTSGGGTVNRVRLASGFASTTAPVTMVMWVKLDNIALWDYIFTQNYAPVYNYLGLSATGQLSFEYVSGSNRSHTSTFTIPASIWTLVIYKFTGSSITIKAKSVGDVAWDSESIAGTLRTNSTTDNPLGIIGHSTSPDDQLDGLSDQFRRFNRATTDIEDDNLFNGGAGC